VDPECNVSTEDTLLHVCAYLNRLFEWCDSTTEFDVRDFIAANPFQKQDLSGFVPNPQVNRRDAEGFTVVQINNRRQYLKSTHSPANSTTADPTAITDSD